jgi:CheY-like chemotaxis protein
MARKKRASPRDFCKIPQVTPPRRILLAEDSPFNRTWLRTALHRLGEIHETAETSELLACLAEEGPFDLVVCPRSLGGQSGEQILAMARTAGLRTPFLLIAPFANPRLRAQVRRLGRAAVLDDPLDLARLLDLAEELTAETQAAPPPASSPAEPAMTP